MSDFRVRTSFAVITALFVFFCHGCFAGPKVEKSQPVVNLSSGETAFPLRPAVSPEPAGAPAVLPPVAEPSRAEQVMTALAAAHPDRVGPAEYRNGDWAVFLAGKWFYYSEGKLLPEDMLDKAGEYSGQPFYTYQAELPAWTPPTEEESERMRQMTERRRSGRQLKRSQFFYDDLYRVHNRDDSSARVKQIRLFGHSVMVHYSILEQLSLVEERILREAETSTAVRQWINSINKVDGWNWRNIAETESRSFHSYGLAVDILPKSTNGLATYWLWTSQYNPEWWAVPYSGRLHPPAEVIKAFEAFGFIWGGKWTIYDTMHFEYRPEILVFSDIPMADSRTDLP